MLGEVIMRAVGPKELIVAVDHGLSYPNMPGLGDPVGLLQRIAAIEGVHGVIATPGLYRQAERCGISLEHLWRLITVDCVCQANAAELSQREIIITPDDAAAYRPHAYKMFLNLYDDQAELMRNIKDLSRFVAAGQRLGIKTLAEIMFFGNTRFADPAEQARELCRGCRIAMELGADYLKVPMIDDLNALAEMIDRLRLPTYILGGASNHDSGALTKAVGQLKALPIRGLMFGRSLWQQENLEDRIAMILHQLHAA